MLTASPADRLTFKDSSVTEVPCLTARFLQLRADAVKHSENLCRGADLKPRPTAVWRVRSRVSTTPQTEKTTTGTFFWASLTFKQRQRTNVTRGIFISYKDLSRRRFSLLTILQHAEMGGGDESMCWMGSKTSKIQFLFKLFCIKKEVGGETWHDLSKTKKKKPILFTSVVSVNKPLRGCFGARASDSSDCWVGCFNFGRLQSNCSSEPQTASNIARLPAVQYYPGKPWDLAFRWMTFGSRCSRLPV